MINIADKQDPQAILDKINASKELIIRTAKAMGLDVVETGEKMLEDVSGDAAEGLAKMASEIMKLKDGLHMIWSQPTTVEAQEEAAGQPLEVHSH